MGDRPVDFEAAADAAAGGRAPFLALIGHEIRTPLSGLLGVLGVIEQRVEALDIDQADLQKMIRLAQSSGEQLRRLLTDLIDLARIDAGHFEVSFAAFSPKALIEDIVHFWAVVAQDRGLGLRLDMASDLHGLLWGDSRRLRQVLDNLLSNAVKFTKTGDVRVRAWREDTALMLEVIDTGPGISETQAAHIFREGPLQPLAAHPSFLSQSPESQGAGLGLVICRQLVAQMGGEIALLSHAPGAVFRVSIPWLAPPSAPMSLSELEPEAVPSLELMGRILLVEDVALNQLVLTAMLERMGCEVQVASDGQDALQLLERTPIDVVLMDMSMPVMDGIATTEAIRRKTSALARLPIIGMTAYDGGEECAAMQRAGVDAMLFKPVTAHALHAVLRRFCGRSCVRSEAR